MFTLIFPVAGEGSRFGGTFKPLLPIGDITFIEKVYEPFQKYEDRIQEVLFICTKDQEKRYNAVERLITCLPNKNVRVIIIDEPTSGPLKTVQSAIKKAKLSGPAIICDCDHSLDVDPLMEQISLSQDALIPTWSIDESEYANWSKVMHDDGKIRLICEKEHLASNTYTVDGIIGCVWFRDLVDLLNIDGDYISDALKRYVEHKKSVGIVPIKKAFFFGTPKMYENCIDQFRKQLTIFCDIDGTLVEHKNHSDCEVDKAVMCRGFQKIEQYRNQGHHIILTTARSEKYRKDVEPYLKELGIPYDQLVMGLPAGPRVLINDRKPAKPFTKQAVSFEIPRNKGISRASLEDIIKSNNIEIVKEFEGNSFAKTYLLKDNNMVFVRKHITKDEDNEVHCKKLRRQAEDLERLSFYSPEITPKVYQIVENEFEIYYDMEYLQNYIRLDEIANYTNVRITLSKMEDELYCIKKDVEGMDWLTEFMRKKLYAKFNMYEVDETLDWLVNADSVSINGKKYKGLRSLLESVDHRYVKPKFLCPVHGDFTFENVMINYNQSTDGLDVKLIDMDGGDYLDAPELDLGKMCQSVMADYKCWRSLDDDDLIFNINDSMNSIECVDTYFSFDKKHVTKMLDKWRDILNEDTEGVLMKGMFYMATYFIRFVPFRLNISRNHGIFALVMAIIWLSKVHQGDIDNEH